MVQALWGHGRSQFCRDVRPRGWLGHPDRPTHLDDHRWRHRHKAAHWLVADISPQLSSLPEGAASNLSAWTELKPYVGPFPPSGTHDYEFTLYALTTDRLSLQLGVALEAFSRAAEQNSLATATLIGKFTKIN